MGNGLANIEATATRHGRERTHFYTRINTKFLHKRLRRYSRVLFILISEGLGQTQDRLKGIFVHTEMWCLAKRKMTMGDKADERNERNVEGRDVKFGRNIFKLPEPLRMCKICAIGKVTDGKILKLL